MLRKSEALVANRDVMLKDEAIPPSFCFIDSLGGGDL
jgi:hypothetical protein